MKLASLYRSLSLPFARSDRYFGTYAVPADVNGDAAIDFVVPRLNNGPDGRDGTADDFTTLVTLLNTTPAGPARSASGNFLGPAARVAQARTVRRPPIGGTGGQRLAARRAGRGRGLARRLDCLIT